MCYPRPEGTLYPLNLRLDEHHNNLKHFGEDYGGLSLSGFEPRLLSCPAHTLVTVPLLTPGYCRGMVMYYCTLAVWGPRQHSG